MLKLSLTPVRPDGRCEIIEEGKILAELDHPNLVRVYDSDFHDDRPYIVMEYVRGQTLEQVASGGGLKPRQAAALLAKVAAAADYAHRKGIVHRDIKPKNILVDEAGEPRLIDFGMARLRHAWSDDPGSPGGTFAFMAPEQARIESLEEQEKVGPRATSSPWGRALLPAHQPGPISGSELAGIHGPRPAVATSTARPSTIRKIPRDLRGICLKAMAAEPADRYRRPRRCRMHWIRFVIRPKILAAAVGVAGLVFIGVLVYALGPSKPDATLRRATVVIHQTPPVALAGDLTVRVWSKMGNVSGD